MRVTRHDTTAAVLEACERNRAKSLAAAAWDAMWGQRRFYASSGWLRVAEDTADIAPFALVADDGDAAYALPCYPIGSSSPFPFCRVDLVLGAVLAGSAGGRSGDLLASLLPSLLLGGRNPGHSGFGVAQAPSPAAATDAIHALVDRAEWEAGNRGLRSVAMLYVDDEDDVGRQAFTDRGYQCFTHIGASLLTVPRGGLNGYLGTLSPRDAGTVRRELRKLDAAGVRYDIVEPDEVALAEVDALERNLNRKYGGTYDDAAVAKLRHSMARHLDGLFVARARLAERTVGSLLAIRWRDEIYARTVGFDYAAIPGVPVYFGLLFYFLVDHAQRHDIRTIFYATGAQDAKRRRGCHTVAQHAFVKSLDIAVAERLRRAPRRPWSPDPDC